jgi:endonuclease III
MSRLTVELMGRSAGKLRSGRWPKTFDAIADRLVAAYGAPALGNFLDPVEEVFYIVLSARTTEAQYRKTHAALRTKFPALADLAAAPVEEILPCISGGGLANKRASQVRRLAAEFLKMGEGPSRRLMEMSARDVFAFLTNLPGMGPKSALCVMMFSLGHDAFPVDTNVQRVASRVGAIPAGLKHYQAQQRLPALVPEGRSKELHIGMVIHGRTTCLPRAPRCESCVLRDLCAWARRTVRERGA